MIGLAEAYAEGDGVPKDETEARNWYGKAADQGDDYSQLALGLRCETGPGPADFVQSYKWLALAVKALDLSDDHHSTAADHLKSVSAKMTPAQIAEAKKLADTWKPAPMTP
jgi:TPR repeat protein